MILTDFIFNKLDGYFHEEDTYKDIDGVGLLQRFLRVSEAEWNANLLPKIDNLTDIIDPTTAPESLLLHIAYTLGGPLNILKDSPGFEFFYRNYLKYALSINKIKGTKLSYEVLFRIMGYSIQIPLVDEPAYTYDPDSSGVSYDGEGVNYDTDGCTPCGKYGLILSNLDPLNTPRVELNNDNIALINSIINYLQPADMKFTEGLLVITINGSGDLVYYNTSDSITFELDLAGDLIVTGPNAEQYSIVDGNLIRTT